jgi:hypothetical protein
MKTADTVDAARVELFLADLRLPAIKQVCGQRSPSNPTRKLARSSLPGGARRT